MGGRFFKLSDAAAVKCMFMKPCVCTYMCVVCVCVCVLCVCVSALYAHM